MKIIITLLFLVFAVQLFAVPITEQRSYEAVVVRGSRISAFNGIPINDIYMYAYDETSQSMHMIPFQIDERIRTTDPFNEDTERHSYFIHDNDTLDHDDELVFLARDLGAKAPAHIWIDNDEALNNERVEVQVYDPQNPDQRAYGYLFHSSTITEPVPTPYQFEFDPEQDIVRNSNYAVRMGRPGALIEDITFFSPLGSGQDIFDTQKLRLVGLLSTGLVNLTFGKGGLQAINERDFLYIYPFEGTPKAYLGYTKKPVVRLIREVRQTIRLGNIPIDDIPFYVTTKFYPFSGTLEGGSSLDAAKLNEMFPDADDLYMEFDVVRQSWDFNENAAGMKFYNPRNDGILIDGSPDEVDQTIDYGDTVSTWTMASGDQGTLFTHIFVFDSSENKTARLYYHDNSEGGQNDDTYIEGGDTGDSSSYGDQGLLVRKSQSLELGFTAYFVDKNKDQTFAEQLASHVENPVEATSKAITFPTNVDESHGSVPGTFQLHQNYPNPFNNLTVISFDVPEQTNVRVKIFNMNGQVVSTLLDRELSAGQHRVHWNGTNQSGNTLPSGVYIVNVATADENASNKIVLMK